MPIYSMASHNLHAYGDGEEKENSKERKIEEGTMKESPRRGLAQAWLSGFNRERVKAFHDEKLVDERNNVPEEDKRKQTSAIHEKSSLESVQVEYDESNSPPMSYSKNVSSNNTTKHRVRIGGDITLSPRENNDSLGMISRIYNSNTSPTSNNEVYKDEKPQKKIFLGRSLSSPTQHDKPMAPPSSSPSFNQPSSPRQTKSTSSSTTNTMTGSPLRFDSYLSSSVKLVKQMMEKYSLNEIATQRVDDSCFIANLVKGGSPVIEQQSSPRHSFQNRVGSPRIERELSSSVSSHYGRAVENAKESPKSSKQSPIASDKKRSQSLLEKHKLELDEFLNDVSSSSSSDDESNLEENDSKLPDPAKNPREYYEFMLAQALAKKSEKKEPGSNEYEKMADLTFEESMSTLKKTLDSAERIKEESLTSHTQRRRVYDSLKRGLGARPFDGTSPEGDVKPPPSSPRTPLPQQHQPLPNPSSPSQNSYQPAFKFENEASTIDTKPRKKDSALEVFQRLYTIKKPPEDESSTSETPRSPRSSKRPSSPANDTFVNRMKLCEEERQQRLEDLRSKFNNNLKKDVSFSPKINDNSKSMQRSVESLLLWQKEKTSRKEQLIKIKKEKEVPSECTFSPELSPRSQKLAKKKSTIPIALREY
ncbi:hypothetical protein C9374_008349 [Naegleria lovaniensis]|uniref:Uncharacterized protein n=1 Tax=Naegleria lovaniensis TaxID=51637 RepID=A0AA88KHH7_NAELO|nr:uncharacterized protein C9374_008349 [Naegleria lovaniensis]KAG2378206.1 hypothetical protein C9374_008349 [Naegleria lovaniensis]